MKSGRKWELRISRKSSLPEGKGIHYALVFADDDKPQEEIPIEDRLELLGVAYVLAFELSSAIAKGKFRVELNGPEAAHRPHFHVHIVCPSADLKLRRSIDPIAAPEE